MANKNNNFQILTLIPYIFIILRTIEIYKDVQTVSLVL